MKLPSPSSPHPWFPGWVSLHRPSRRRRAAWLLLLSALFALGVGLAGSAVAQDDPPGRVGRLARVEGPVWWFDEAAGRWQPAVSNWPLTGGDRLATGPAASAEVRIGSTTLRLGAASEVELQRVDDERLVVALRSGRLALRLRSREVAAETEIATPEATLLPQRAGLYRVDRVDDTTWAAAWRGRLDIADGPPGFAVEGARRVEIWREGRAGEAAPLRLRDGAPVDDAFAAAVLRDDADDERAVAQRFASPEMTGIEELDRDGRWDSHPEYGAIWVPLTVAADWAPYRFGRWAWVRPWGWTWIDDARWGFAPSHYGRWIHWHGRWGWAPGDRVARPVFAPALVAWVGGPALSVSIGLPAVGWLPLAPWERYVPWHRHTPVYVDRVNRGRWDGPRRGGPPPGVWGNQHVPGALTVVPRDVLWQQRPVRGEVVDARLVPGQPLWVPPPPRPGSARDEAGWREAPRFARPRPDGPGRDTGGRGWPRDPAHSAPPDERRGEAPVGMSPRPAFEPPGRDRSDGRWGGRERDRSSDSDRGRGPVRDGRAVDGARAPDATVPPSLPIAPPVGRGAAPGGAAPAVGTMPPGVTMRPQPGLPPPAPLATPPTAAAPILVQRPGNNPGPSREPRAGSGRGDGADALPGERRGGGGGGRGGGPERER